MPLAAACRLQVSYDGGVQAAAAGRSHCFFVWLYYDGLPTTLLPVFRVCAVRWIPPCYPSQEEGEMATVCGPVVATPARLSGGLWTCVRERGSKNKVPQHTLSLPPPTAFFIHAFWPSSSLWFLLQVLPHAIIILFKKNSFFYFVFITDVCRFFSFVFVNFLACL